MMKVVPLQPHQPVHVNVSSQGTEVVLQVGHVTMNMNYQDALKIADFIRFRANEAKRYARDTSRTIHIVANLTDVETELDMHANIKEI